MTASINPFAAAPKAMAAIVDLEQNVCGLGLGHHTPARASEPWPQVMAKHG